MDAADGHDGREGVGNGARVFLVNVGNLADRGADHGDGGESALLLFVVHELTPETEIGPDDRTPRFDVEIRLTQRHPFVLDEIGDGERGGTTDASHAVQQCPTTSILNFFYFVCDWIEVIIQPGARVVFQSEEGVNLGRCG